MCLFCDTSAGRLNYRRMPVQPSTVAEKLAGNADIILHGGPILTMDSVDRIVEAVSVRHGLVQSSGSLEQALSRKGRLTRVVDLEGRALLPGFVMADRQKEPADFLDWQHIPNLPALDDDVAACLSGAVKKSMFGEPVLVELESVPTGTQGDATVIRALADICGATPTAVRYSNSSSGYLNGPMRRIAFGSEDPHGVEFSAVADMSVALRRWASEQIYSLDAVTRAVDRELSKATRGGFTTKVDMRVGSLAGRLEIDAAAHLLERSRRICLRGAAHSQLRREWDGRLPPEFPEDRLRVDLAAVDFENGSSSVMEEATTLHEAGWRIVFNAESDKQLDTILDACSGLPTSSADVSGRHAVQTSFMPGRAHREAIDALGLRLLFNDTVAADADRFDDVEAELHSLTRQTALRYGIEDIAGLIEVGRRADFTVLTEMPTEAGEFRVDTTWVEGAPV